MIYGYCVIYRFNPNFFELIFENSFGVFEA
nr:MAG TPA: hypothetical protein [Caudoviricetes sp.]